MLVVFQDDNDNHGLDHNFLESGRAYGFSNEVRRPMFTGVPDFDDRSFHLAKPDGVQRITIEWRYAWTRVLMQERLVYQMNSTLLTAWRVK